MDTRGGNNFVGRTRADDDLESAGRALRIAQIPTGVGYENSLLDLPKPSDEFPDVPRQFLMYNRGGNGFKEIITVSRTGSHTTHTVDLGSTGVGARQAVHGLPSMNRTAA